MLFKNLFKKIKKFKAVYMNLINLVFDHVYNLNFWLNFKIFLMILYVLFSNKNLKIKFCIIKYFYSKISKPFFISI